MIDIKVGTMLWDDWIVDGKIGMGSYGTVYRIVQEKDGLKKYAVCKELLISDAYGTIDSAALEGMDPAGSDYYFRSVFDDFMNEITLQKELFGEPTICQYLGHRRLDGQLLILLEMLIPLTERIRNQKLHFEDILHIGIDLCDALYSCKAKNILHKDIKYDNVLYDDHTQTYKLGDFGVSCKANSAAPCRGRMGRLSYMAPEVYHGMGHTFHTDLYSVGILLYKLLNENRIPFLPYYPITFTQLERDMAIEQRLQGGTVPLPYLATMQFRYKQAVPSLNGIAENIAQNNLWEMAEYLGHVVCKALSFQLEDRYADSEALRTVLNDLLLNMN